MACGIQRLTSLVDHPVIGTLHEVGVYFDSIETMVETTIAWVSQPDWEPGSPTPHELDIWRSDNRAVAFRRPRRWGSACCVNLGGMPRSLRPKAAPTSDDGQPLDIGMTDAQSCADS